MASRQAQYLRFDEECRASQLEAEELRVARDNLLVCKQRMCQDLDKISVRQIKQNEEGVEQAKHPLLAVSAMCHHSFRLKVYGLIFGWPCVVLLALCLLLFLFLFF